MSPNPSKDRRAVLNFEGKRYNLNEMPDELKLVFKDAGITPKMLNDRASATDYFDIVRDFGVGAYAMEDFGLTKIDEEESAL